MVDNKIVVGALMDFVGQLTTTEKEIKTGAMHTVYDIHDALMTFCEHRNLDMKDADVENWRTELAKVRIL